MFHALNHGIYEFTVQITHNLNGIRMSHANAKTRVASDYASTYV